MDAIKLTITVDENVAGAIPQLRPLLGQRVEMVARDVPQKAETGGELTLDDFLAHRLKRPEDVPPVSLKDMEDAIGRSASDDHA